jgi:hypothetical protein
MSQLVPVAIEVLVAILLVATISYCIMLNRRIVSLRADEQALKATIAELVTATEIAERAIAGLKTTVQDCDAVLGDKLHRAESLAEELDTQIATGDQVVRRLGQIVAAARAGTDADAGQPTRDPRSPASQAQAIVERLRLRASGAAA